MSVLPAIPPDDAGNRVRAYVLGFLEERFKDDAFVLAAMAEAIVKGIEADRRIESARDRYRAETACAAVVDDDADAFDRAFVR